MTTDRLVECLVSLVRDLCKLLQETKWVEFKVNHTEPQDVGEYLRGMHLCGQRQTGTPLLDGHLTPGRINLVELSICSPEPTCYETKLLLDGYLMADQG